MAKRKPEDYLTEPYERVILPEDGGGYSAYISEFEGCHAFGETPNEAFKNLEEVAKEWIEAALDQNKEIPSAWNAQEFSGRFALRLPKYLHQELAKRAEREGTSLNQYILGKLSGAVREDAILEKLEEITRMRIFPASATISLAITGPFIRINVPASDLSRGTSTEVIEAKNFLLTSGKQAEESYG